MPSFVRRGVYVRSHGEDLRRKVVGRARPGGWRLVKLAVAFPSAIFLSLFFFFLLLSISVWVGFWAGVSISRCHLRLGSGPAALFRGCEGRHDGQRTWCAPRILRFSRNVFRNISGGLMRRRPRGEIPSWPTGGSPISDSSHGWRVAIRNVCDSSRCKSRGAALSSLQGEACGAADRERRAGRSGASGRAPRRGFWAAGCATVGSEPTGSRALTRVSRRNVILRPALSSWFLRGSSPDPGL